MPSSPTRSVLLDLDGTLVDSVHLHVAAWAAALRGRGYDVPLVSIHAGIGLGGDRLLSWLLGAPPEDAGELAAEHRERFLAQRDVLIATDGSQELLDDLRRREVPHAIATSAGDQEREVLLGRLDLPDDIPVVGPSEQAASKPAPDLLLDACDQLGVDPGGTTLIGDAPWDAVAASAAGARCIAVRCGGFADTTLLAAGADRVVDAPRDLVALLG